MTITGTPTPDQISGLQFATDNFNAKAKAEFDHATRVAFDAAQAALPKDQPRVPFDPTTAPQYVPLTPEQYAWINLVSPVLDNYRKQELAAAANDPANQALFQKALSLSPEGQAAIRAVIAQHS